MARITFIKFCKIAVNTRKKISPARNTILTDEYDFLLKYHFPLNVNNFEDFQITTIFDTLVPRAFPFESSETEVEYSILIKQSSITRVPAEAVDRYP